MRQEWFPTFLLFLALLDVSFGHPSYKRSADISTQAFQSLTQLILSILDG